MFKQIILQITTNKNKFKKIKKHFFSKFESSKELKLFWKHISLKNVEVLTKSIQKIKKKILKQKNNFCN